MQFETPRLTLRPVAAADTPAIARVIFGDPDVTAMLAHNTRAPEDALKEAARWTRIMGIDGDGGIWNAGGLGLFALIPKPGGDLAGVAGFYMERGPDGRWSGEYFYALGSAWHGLGLMSEAADALGKKLRDRPDLGVFYGVYWDLINQASGRILRRSGLVPAGRKMLLEEYDAARCRRMFDYDLWRLAACRDPDKRRVVAVQAARRAGAFVAEDVVSRDEALAALTAAHGAGALPPEALAMLDRAIAAPGMAYLELRVPGVTGPPANRLG